MGLPGCVGSIDATFVPCNKLPETFKNLAAGEKGKGVLFNVVVDHSRRVLNVQESVFATINDKISVVYNEFLNALENRRIYHGLAYRIQTGPDETDFIELSQTLPS